jgi:hypothetical protein
MRAPFLPFVFPPSYLSQLRKLELSDPADIWPSIIPEWEQFVDLLITNAEVSHGPSTLPKMHAILVTDASLLLRRYLIPSFG